MASPLVETKLDIPKLRRSLVARPRLSGRLSGGAESRLTLISAPAGFGKTTLLAATGTERSVAWLDDYHLVDGPGVQAGMTFLPGPTAPPSSKAPLSTRRRCTDCSGRWATSASRCSRSTQLERHHEVRPTKEEDMATTAPSRAPMGSTRRTALVVGSFYLITFAASIPAVFLLAPVLDNADYIVSSGADTRVLWGCFLDLVNALACIGTAVALFPVVKRQNEATALGFVTTRLLEAAIILIGVVSLLAVVTLRQDLAGAPGTDTAALVTTGRALVAVRDWTFLLGPSLMPGINALLLGSLLYRSGLVPRVIPVLGLIGGAAAHRLRNHGPVPRQPPGHGVGGDRDRPDLPVGAVARRLAGRQGLQALPHHHWHGRRPDPVADRDSTA